MCCLLSLGLLNCFHLSAGAYKACFNDVICVSILLKKFVCICDKEDNDWKLIPKAAITKHHWL